MMRLLHTRTHNGCNYVHNAKKRWNQTKFQYKQGKGHEVWLLIEKLVAIDRCESHFFKKGFSLLRGYPCSSRWTHTHTHTGRPKLTQWVYKREWTWSCEGKVVEGIRREGMSDGVDQSMLYAYVIFPTKYPKFTYIAGDFY